MKRVWIYARVSTTDKGQDLTTQTLPLKEYAKQRGRTITKVYTDQISWSKEKRPWLDELMNDACKRKFDVVLVFRFDRMSRSTKQLITTLDTFRALGIDFVSYNENIDTSTPTWKMMFTMISAFAEFERSVIQERVKVWLLRAKKQGKKLWRPKKYVSKIKIQELRKAWCSIRDIAKKMKVSKSLVWSICKGEV